MKVYLLLSRDQHGRTTVDANMTEHDLGDQSELWADWVQELRRQVDEPDDPAEWAITRPSVAFAVITVDVNPTWTERKGPTMTLIRCRAQLAEGCHHGQPELPDAPQHEDGTFISDNGREPRVLCEPGLAGTIICDFCYALVMPFTPSGAGLTDELPEAVAAYRRNAAIAAEHPDPAVLRAEANHAAGRAPAGSATLRSAIACRNIADHELERRGR